MNTYHQAAAAYREAATLRSDSPPIPNIPLISDASVIMPPTNHALVDPAKLRSPVVRADTMPLPPAHHVHPYRKSQSFHQQPPQQTQNYTGLLFSNNQHIQSPPALLPPANDHHVPTQSVVNLNNQLRQPANMPVNYGCVNPATTYTQYMPSEPPVFNPPVSLQHRTAMSTNQVANGPMPPPLLNAIGPSSQRRYMPVEANIVALEAGGDSQATLVDESLSSSQNDKGWYAKMVNAVSSFGKKRALDPYQPTSTTTTTNNIYVSNNQQGIGYMPPQPTTSYPPYNSLKQYSHQYMPPAQDFSVITHTPNTYAQQQNQYQLQPNQLYKDTGSSMSGPYNGFSKVHPGLRQYQNRQHNIGIAHE